jgi:glycosyltransferase involved in cell wall biosynthesis
MSRLVTEVGAVVIGRNEGERLRRCLASLSAVGVVIYVDSGSTDGSAQWAHEQAAEVVELDASMPYTAARARNSGFRRLRKLAPELCYVQFVDGDCELMNDWLSTAFSFLESHPDVGAVFGRRRERFPGKSIYNWLCDLEWDRPLGEARAFGGDVMMRVSALEAVGGYRDDVIAAEDDELCVRLRAAGWRIWRIGGEMTLHDAALTHFSQWWRRSVRCGYAFALGSHLHGSPPERHFVWQSRRAWFWGVWLPLGCTTAGLLLGPWGWVTWLIYPLQLLRQTIRNDGDLPDRALLALFQLLARFPEALGQIKFTCDRLRAHTAQIIEYK